MPENESILVVPLRSNAYTLVTGMPIAAMRRRLKFASLFYDRLILETGIFRVHAGPDGFSSFIVPPTQRDPARWQAPTERHAATGEPFTVMLTSEGRPDATPIRWSRRWPRSPGLRLFTLSRMNCRLAQAGWTSASRLTQQARSLG